MTEQLPKPKRNYGGKREGAGRPKTGRKVRALQVAFNETDLAMLAELEAAGYGNKRTQIIRRALREALERIRTKP